MISLFPNFEILDMGIKKEYEAFSRKFPCYTEFNFQELFVWNTEENVCASILNDNLVVMRPDYITNEPVLSFLGENKIEDTCTELLNYSLKLGSKPVLKNIPRELIKKDRLAGLFKIEDDIDHYDYILDANEHALLKGKQYASIREKINKFLKRYHGRTEVKILDISQKINQNIFWDLFERWAISAKKTQEDVNHEKLAIGRAFEYANELDLRTVGVFIDGVLVACAIQALTDDDYEVGLFLKADYNYERIYNYIVLATSQTCLSYGKKFINIEHDLGIQGLRVAKSQLHPKFFFEKYQIS